MKIDLESFDLTQLPDSEDENFEFKSSLTEDKDLRKKLSCAASGFANSGGGCFIVGVDENGNADGGISSKVGHKGRQDRRDWVDQILHKVEPPPRYEIKLINNSMERGNITEDNIVLLVYIDSSNTPPHMAPDGCYYIRAGAHTVKAKHFIVEALWAKRYFSKPKLQYLLSPHPEKEGVIQLKIIAVTEAAATNVQIQFNPIPKRCSEKLFPLKISVVDRQHSFSLDIALYSDVNAVSDFNTVMTVKYYDFMGNDYEDETKLFFDNSLPPMVLGKTSLEKIAKSIESIDKNIKYLIDPPRNF